MIASNRSTSRYHGFKAYVGGSCGQFRQRVSAVLECRPERFARARAREYEQLTTMSGTSWGVLLLLDPFPLQDSFFHSRLHIIHSIVFSSPLLIHSLHLIVDAFICLFERRCFSLSSSSSPPSSSSPM